MKLPNDFEHYLRQHWSAADVEALAEGLSAEPQTSIRLNTRRLSADTALRYADGHVPWCPEGIYLSQRPAFTADPLLHAGAYYVQEASSMFLAHVIRHLMRHSSSENDSSSVTRHFQSALDLCAAPGGKSTLLRSLLPDDCLLVANEPQHSRAQVLAENIAKWGHPGVVVTQAFAADIARIVAAPRRRWQRFDLILTDVPCSGEGMMRKEAEAARQWSPRLVSECAALQRSIVADIWPALKDGGTLIYSTCTFNPEEDEQNVEWIARELGADVIEIPTDPAWGIRGDMRVRPDGLAATGTDGPLPCCHFLPGQVRGEGFFVAVLRKKGEDDEPAAAPAKERRKDRAPQTPQSMLAEALRQQLRTLPTTLLDAVPDDRPAAGRRAADDTAPLPRVNVTIDDAIRYLQREAFALPPETPRGIVQVCYRDQRLGLMKNLGTRANNLYPKEWRIRSSFVKPESIVEDR